MKQTNIDKENLRQVILDSPKQFAEGLKLAENIRIKGDFTSLEISGMGGSSLPANILRIYLSSIYKKDRSSSKRFGIFQNRFYALPHEAYNNCLNFFASYSGNTEETVASLEEAIKHKLPSVGFATGGKVLKLCQKNNIPCVVLPAGIQPRYATGYFFTAMLKVLTNAGMVDINSEEIVKLSKKLQARVAGLEKNGKEIAKKLVGKTPVIYASTDYKSLAMIWKIKINENAKTPAFYNFYPELNHNEMVGYTLPQGKFHIVTLLDKEDHPKNIQRMQLTAKLLKKKGIGTTFVGIEGGSVFEKIFSTLLIGDWASYHLALKYNQDPTPVKIVEDLKKLLA